MKPSKFAYHAPTTSGEAAGLLGEYGFDAKILAGGQSLVPMMALRMAAFEHLVDINGVEELSEIKRVGDDLRIGTIVRQATAEHDPVVSSDVPLLAAALPHIGHFQIRNRGTVGGSIAHADPASELPAVALALGATMEVVSAAGSRDVAAADFVESVWQTTMADNEMLAAVRFPVWSGTSGFAIEEVTRRHGDFALVGAAVGVTLDGESVSRAAIGLFGVGPAPVRATGAEEALMAGGVSADLAEIGRIAADPLDPLSDVHASSEYRRRVAATVVARALLSAMEDARA